MPGSPNNVSAGPGWLFVAPFGTTEPTDATTPLGTGWEAIGFTDDGTTFSRSVTREKLKVAESIHPIKSYTTEEVTTVKFSMAEMTARNLLLALNGGLVEEPESVAAPDTDAEQYVALVHETVDGARWLFRKAMQVGTIEVASKQAPQKRLIPVEFELYLPEDGGKPFEAFPNADGLI